MLRDLHQAKSRKYREMFEVNSPEILQVREKNWSQQVEDMQVPNGRDQVSGGVSVPCQHATPVATSDKSNELSARYREKFEYV